MVTEAVETLQEAVLQSQGQMLGAGQLSLLQLGHVQVWAVCWCGTWWYIGRQPVGTLNATSLKKVLCLEASLP